MPPSLRLRAKGALVAPNVLAPSVVYANRPGGQGAYTNQSGGYWWGGGPRQFVGPSRPPETVIEVGRDGDFVEGDHVWGPSDVDRARGWGFPHATRWPGYVGGWEPPFFARHPGQPTDGWGGRFLGGALLEGRVSTVFACVDLIGRSLATFPILSTRDSVPVPNPPWTENPEPEVYTSMVDAMKCVVNSLCIRGQAFIAPTARYVDNTVARWVVLNPDMVKVSTVDGLPRYDVQGIGEVPRSELLHVRYQVWPGVAEGVGPMEAAWRNLISADALERWGTELAVANGIPTAILQSASKLTKRQADEIKTSWAEAAYSRGTLPAVLSGGLTYTPLNLKPSDIGLLDLRQFDEARIASVFGVPLWFVGLPNPDSLTYSTVEGAFDYLWRATLRAMSFNIMQALSGFCMARGVFVRHDAEAFVRPDLATRANAYATMLASNITTVDEVRTWEGLPPLGQAVPAVTAANTDGGI